MQLAAAIEGGEQGINYNLEVDMLTGGFEDKEGGKSPIHQDTIDNIKERL